MKNLFIPYELAVIAKEKGFNEPCFTYWYTTNWQNPKLHGKDVCFSGYTNYPDSNTIAPLYWQIIEWLKEKDLLVCEELTWDWCIYRISNGQNLYLNLTIDEAIKKAFELI